MNTGAAKSEGSSRTTSLRVSTPPADAPITTARIEDFIMSSNLLLHAQRLDLSNDRKGLSLIVMVHFEEAAAEWNV
jgi:hypothetical protein